MQCDQGLAASLPTAVHHAVLAESLNNPGQQPLPVLHGAEQPGLGSEEGGQEALAGVEPGPAQLPPAAPPRLLHTATHSCLYISSIFVTNQSDLLSHLVQLVFLSSEEPDQLPDDRLGGGGQSGRGAGRQRGLDARQEELGVHSLQQRQGARQAVHKHGGGQLGQDLAEGDGRDPPQEGSGLSAQSGVQELSLTQCSCILQSPVFAALEKLEHALHGETRRHVGNAETGQLARHPPAPLPGRPPVPRLGEGGGAAPAAQDGLARELGGRLGAGGVVAGDPPYVHICKSTQCTVQTRQSSMRDARPGDHYMRPGCQSS